MAYAACAALQELGGRSTAGELQAWLSSNGAYSDETRRSTTGLGMRQALQVCRELSLIVEDGLNVRLAATGTGLAAFRSALRDTLLREENNLDLFSTRDTTRSHEL